jgi:hypothetical protein
MSEYCHLENQQPTASTSQKPLDCEGRSCPTCGKCHDWYYTGNLDGWNWCRTHSNSSIFTDEDWSRWSHEYELWKRRDGSTCVGSAASSGSDDYYSHVDHPVRGVGVGSGCFCKK